MREENASKWEAVIETMRESFLDKIFDVKSRVSREEFIQAVAKK